MRGEQRLVAPTLCAEADEVDQGAERGELEKSPDRHIVEILIVDACAVGAAAAHPKLAKPVISVGGIQRGRVIGDDCVAVLPALHCFAQYLNLLKMFYVERH